MKPITYGSLFSGVEAASLAVSGLGFRPRWFAEIDPFCSAFLKHRFPNVPNLGDVSKIKTAEGVDVIFAGAPCQAFSLAGRRGGIADSRGNLTLEWLRLVGTIRPRWFVFENVPGILSVDGGRTFGLLLAALSELGYGVAWRVLDARYFGVPQRRRRLFLVGHSGGGVGPAASVLFEPEGVQGRPQQGQAEGKADTGDPSDGARAPCRGRRSVAFYAKQDASSAGVEVSPTLLSTPKDRKNGRFGGVNGVAALSFLPYAGATRDPVVIEEGTGCLRSCDQYHGVLTFKEGAGAKAGGMGIAAEEACTLGSSPSGNQRTPALLSVAENGRNELLVSAECFGTLNKSGGSKPGPCGRPVVLKSEPFVVDEDGLSRLRVGQGPMTAVKSSGGARLGALGKPTILAIDNDSRGSADEVAYSLRAGHRGQQMVTDAYRLRRLTPLECERLMGFPDDWTKAPYRGKPASDSTRYGAIGNSFVVDVVRWISRRIATIERASKTPRGRK